MVLGLDFARINRTVPRIHLKITRTIFVGGLWSELAGHCWLPYWRNRVDGALDIISLSGVNN